MAATTVDRTQVPQDEGGAADAVVLRGVSVHFRTDRGTVTALEGIDASVRQGSVTSLIGPSGSGKSTLLRVVADLIKPTEGSVVVLGGTAQDARRARKLGMVFQDAALLPWRTAFDNVCLPLEIGWHGRPRPENGEERARKVLELVGLGGRLQAYPHELSGGMRQRVAIARALVCEPEILLMDEPFGAVDEITRDQLNMELLTIWRATRTTILFVTHSIPEATFLGRQVLMLSSTPGRVHGVFDVNLPDPRDDLRIRETPEFITIAARLRRELEICSP
jgi:NitT/TauT family transport system ATP-binding protein